MRRATHCQPLRVVGLAGGEESLEGVVARDDEASQVGQELTAQVEDDEEEVKDDEADNRVGLGDGGAPLEVAQGGVLAKLWGGSQGQRLTSRVAWRSRGRGDAAERSLPRGQAGPGSAAHGPEETTSCLRRVYLIADETGDDKGAGRRGWQAKSVRLCASANRMKRYGALERGDRGLRMCKEGSRRCLEYIATVLVQETGQQGSWKLQEMRDEVRGEVETGGERSR